MNGSSRQTHRPFNRIRLGSLVVVGSLVAAACTGGSSGPVAAIDHSQASANAFQPTFENAPCPAGITAEEGSAVSCGYLTVLEDRSEPNGRTIRLFVTRAEPLEDDPPPDPMFGLGPLGANRDLGWAQREAKVGSRAGRVEYDMDVPGTGYSEPNLSCPEIEHLTDPSTGITLGRPEMETAFLSAVQACHDRLTAEDIDLASYDLEAMAGDAEDLRTALGIDDWNLISWGTTSSISFEIMRRYPEHIRSVAMDSPMAPQLDQFTQAVVGTEWAFGQVVQACKAKPACHEAFPHLHAAWREALRGLDDHPSEILDEDLEIVVDDATAVRQLRNNLAVGGHTSCFLSCGLDTFPLVVYDLREHGWANGGPAGRLVEWSGVPPFHVGYDIQWWPSVFVPEAELSEGVTYSHLCHDEVPFIDQAALADAAGGRPWYVEAYVESPYPEICERWDVGKAEADPHEPLVTGIPVMMFIGTMDPFSPLPPLKDAATDLSNGSIVKVPVGRNVLENDCMIGIRDAFVDHPMSPPETICVANLERIRFVPPPPPTRSPKPGGVVITTVVGDGAIGSSGDGNLATQAQLSPEDVAVGEAGDLFIVDAATVGRVRKVDASGRISTVVGPPTGDARPAPGQASTVAMNAPTALAIGGDGNLYVGGGNGTRRMITRVDPSSGEVTTIAGTGERGYSGDGGRATDATMTWVLDIAIGGDGTVYFTDFYNQRVRMIDTSGIITTIAGTGIAGFSGDGRPATKARISNPSGIAVDPKGRIYLADPGNHRVRRIDRHGMITTVAGNGEAGYEGDGGPAKKAALGTPVRVTLDADGNLYIKSMDCSCVRMVDPNGVISTIAGTGLAGFSGDGGPATRARLSCCNTGGIAFGPDGALYIADGANLRVRKVVLP